MAKFKNSNIELKTNQEILLGDSQEVSITYDDSAMMLDTTAIIATGTWINSGHMAVGANAVLDYGPSFPQAKAILRIDEELGSDVTSWGVGIAINVDSAGEDVAANTMGLVATAQNDLSSLQNQVIGVYGFANVTKTGAVVTDIIGVQGGASSPATNGTITNILGADFSTVTGFSMSGLAFTKMAGAQFQILKYGSGSVDIVDAYGALIKTPGYTPSGVDVNLYGLYIEDQSGTNFTNDHNIYSAGVNSKNKFEGDVEIDGVLTANIDNTQIIQDDSYVKVVDDGTAFGYIEIVADGVQVSYWDAEAATIRLGKVSGAGKVEVGASAVELYYSGTKMFETKADGVIVYDEFSAPSLVFKDGANNDISRIFNTSGEAYFQRYNGSGWDGGIKITSNSATEFYHQSTKVFQTISNGLLLGSGAGASLAHVGSDFYISNDLFDGIVTLRGTNSADLSSNILVADPNGATDLHYNGVKVFETDSTGIIVTGDVRCDDLYTSGDTIHVGSGGLIFLDGFGDFSIKSATAGAYVRLLATNGSAEEKWVFEGSPDGAASLYFAGVSTLVTTASGFEIKDTSGTDPTLTFKNSGNVNLSQITSDNGALIGQGWNGSSWEKYWRGFPNGGFFAYHDDDLALNTAATGIAVSDTAGTEPTVQFYSSSVGLQGKIEVTDTQMTLEFWDTVYEAAFKANIHGSVELNYAGVKVFETDSTGIIVYGDIYCNDLFTAGDTIHVGASDIKGIADGITMLDSGFIFQSGNSQSITGDGSQVDLTCDPTGGSAGTVALKARKSGGGIVTLLTATQYATQLYYDGNQAFYTQSGGFRLLRPGAASLYADFDINGSGLLSITNNTAGQNVRIRAEETAGVAKNVLFEGDPDGGVDLYFAGVKVFETLSNGIKINNLIDITADSTGIIVTGDIHCNDLYVAGSTVHIGSNVELSSPGGTDYSVTVEGAEVLDLTSEIQQMGDIANGTYFEVDISGTDVMKLVHSNVDLIQAYSTNINVRTPALNISRPSPTGTASTQLSLGNNDNGRGLFSIFGNATGVSGGEARVFLSAAHDDTISYYGFFAQSDDLYIGPDTDTDALKYDGGSDKWVLQAVNGTELFHAGSKVFETDSTGIIVTGDIYCDDLFTSGDTIHVADGQIKSTAGNIELYDNGHKVAATAGSGMIVYSRFDQPGLFFYDSNSSPVGSVSHTTTQFKMSNEINGSHIQLRGNTSLAVSVMMVDADPDTSVDLYYAGVKVFETLSNGIRLNQEFDITTDSTGIVVNGVISADSVDAPILLSDGEWKDINMGSANLHKGGGATPPDDAKFTDEAGSDTGIWTYGFAVGESVHSAFEVQHDYQEGTDVYFHIHFQGITAPSGTDNVKFEITYTISRPDGSTLDATRQIDTGDIPFDTQYAVESGEFGVIDGQTDGPNGGELHIGDQILFTLERITAAGDAYAGDALLSTVGIHYQVDSLGSTGKISK